MPIDKVPTDTLQEMSNDVVQAEYPYWSALLTFNTIVTAIFSGLSVLGTQQNRWLLFALVLVSMVSSLLIILNFRARKELLRTSAQRIINDEPVQVVAIDADRIRKRIHSFEKVIHVLLGIESFMILWLMFPTTC